MDNFEKMLHEMFDDIWDCEIDHPLFQDTVGDLMKAVIEAHKRAPLDFDINVKINKAYDDDYDTEYLQWENDWINDDCISRKMAVEAIEEIVSSMSVCLSVDECHGMKRMQKRAIEEVINLPAIQTTNHISDVSKGDSNDVAIY